MLKDMQSQFAPGKTTKNADVLAGEGKKNTGLAGLGESNASKYSVTEVKDPAVFEVLTKRDDITKKRADAGVELESQEVLETITKDYWG